VESQSSSDNAEDILSTEEYFKRLLLLVFSPAPRQKVLKKFRTKKEKIKKVNICRIILIQNCRIIFRIYLEIFYITFSVLKQKNLLLFRTFVDFS
jgi:hypothetical protein